MIVFLVELEKLLSGEKSVTTDKTGPLNIILLLRAFILSDFILGFVEISKMQNVW